MSNVQLEYIRITIKSESMCSWTKLCVLHLVKAKATEFGHLDVV